MASEIFISLGPGYGLLPDITKPLPEPVLTNYQWGLVASEGNFTGNVQEMYPGYEFENYWFKIS